MTNLIAGEWSKMTNVTIPQLYKEFVSLTTRKRIHKLNQGTKSIRNPMKQLFSDKATDKFVN